MLSTLPKETQDLLDSLMSTIEDAAPTVGDVSKILRWDWSGCHYINHGLASDL